MWHCEITYAYNKRMYDAWLRKNVYIHNIDAISVLRGRHIFTAIDQICAQSNPNTVNGIVTKVYK